MSFQTFVTERLAAITALINAISTNAKKIDELTPQTNLDNSSKIHVSRSGESESITVQQILDTVETVSTQYLNQLISIGEITIATNTLTVPTAQWIINGVNYFISAPVNFTVPYCETGKSRIDILVANTLNQIIRIAGIETTGVSIRPNIPVNTVLVTQLNITDNNILGVEPVDIIPAGIIIDKGTLDPTTTTITPLSGETHFYRITANGTVNGTLAVKVNDVIGISSSALWLESNNNQSDIFNWIRETTPRLLSNTIASQKVFLKDFHAKANKRYKFELMYEVSGLSGAMGFDFGFGAGIESNFRYTLGTKYNSPIVNSAFAYITTNTEMINTSASSSSTGYFVFVTGTFVTSNANKLVKPLLKTSVAQASAYINNSFFVCWEIGESSVGFNGDFQNN